MTYKPSLSSRGAFRYTLFVLILLAAADTNLAPAASHSPNNATQSVAIYAQTPGVVAPLASSFLDGSKRSRAIQITAVCMAMALFIIIWRRT